MLAFGLKFTKERKILCNEKSMGTGIKRQNHKCMIKGVRMTRALSLLKSDDGFSCVEQKLFTDCLHLLLLAAMTVMLKVLCVIF